MKNLLRMMGIILGLFLMVGFGVCGVFGIGLGVSAGIADYGAMPIGFGLLGIALCVGLGFAIRPLWKSARKPASSNDAQQ